MSDGTTRRVHEMEELEISVHHTVNQYVGHTEEYELHAGFADVVEIPKRLVEDAKTATGVDLRDDEVQCGAEIRVIDE